jgi:glycine/D-amino acid oxidase-like deaminating enzyme
MDAEVVVGAGIVGASTALQLARRGGAAPAAALRLRAGARA